MVKELYEEDVIILRKFQLADKEERLAAVKESIIELVNWFNSFETADIELLNENWLHANEINWVDKTEYCFMLKYPGTEKMLGEIRINRINDINKFANLMYWIRTSETGKGLALKGIRLAIKIAFEDLNLNRLEIFMSKGNKASRHLAEKAGAKYEGTMRKRIVVNGRVDDAYLYSIIPEDLV